MTTHADIPETRSDGGPTIGRAHRAESCMSMRVRQMSYDHLRAVARRAAGRCACRPWCRGWDQFRASATPYGLLMDHPIDLQSHCRSCRHPGVFGRY